MTSEIRCLRACVGKCDFDPALLSVKKNDNNNTFGDTFDIKYEYDVNGQKSLDYLVIAPVRGHVMCAQFGIRQIVVKGQTAPPPWGMGLTDYDKERGVACKVAAKRIPRAKEIDDPFEGKCVVGIEPGEYDNCSPEFKAYINLIETVYGAVLAKIHASNYTVKNVEMPHKAKKNKLTNQIYPYVFNTKIWTKINDDGTPEIIASFYRKINGLPVKFEDVVQYSGGMTVIPYVSIPSVFIKQGTAQLRVNVQTALIPKKGCVPGQVPARKFKEDVGDVVVEESDDEGEPDAKRVRVTPEEEEVVDENDLVDVT